MLKTVKMSTASACGKSARTSTRCFPVPVQQRFHRVLVRFAEFGECRLADDPQVLGYQNGNHCARASEHAGNFAKNVRRTHQNVGAQSDLVQKRGQGRMRAVDVLRSLIQVERSRDAGHVLAARDMLATHQAGPLPGVASVRSSGAQTAIAPGVRWRRRRGLPSRLRTPGRPPVASYRFGKGRKGSKGKKP